MAEESVAPSDELVALKLVKKRKHFGAPLQLSDKDSQELFTSAQCECRPFRDPNFDLRRMELDAGVQAVPPSRDAASQAKGGLSKNSNAQTQPREGEVPPDALRSDDMRAFLGRAVPYYEAALQQNECFDVFEDDFSGLGEDDNAPGGKGDLSISESQSFTDLAYSKGRTVSCIGWVPGRKDMVAVSCTDLLSFEERLELDGVVRTSAVLVWAFADAIHPQFVLEAPSDVYSFQFNPAMPSVVVGGLYNGQVVQWDVSGVQDQARACTRGTRSGVRCRGPCAQGRVLWQRKRRRQLQWRRQWRQQQRISLRAAWGGSSRRLLEHAHSSPPRPSHPPPPARAGAQEGQAAGGGGPGQEQPGREARAHEQRRGQPHGGHHGRGVAAR